ncbi:methyltransferase domain-containing protein [Candidatus Woesearchaeota archaeon]|nr:methyltransferase domain-containing protein [Candidatus Woesearchaeota archaeon]
MKKLLKKKEDKIHKERLTKLYNIKTEDRNISTWLRIQRINKLIPSGRNILELSVISEMPWWKRNKVTLADISKHPLNYFKDYNSKQFDFNEPFPFKSKSFDVIVAVEVIEHLYNPENCIKECFRCLKEDGLLIGSVPNEYHLRKRIEILLGKDVFGYGYHLCHFNKKSLTKLLKTSFKKVSIKGYGPGIFYPSLLSSNLIFICKK